MVDRSFANPHMLPSASRSLSKALPGYKKLSIVTRAQRTLVMAAAGRQGTPEIAVVGGGIAGTTCASLLARNGYNVTLFDMGKNHPGEGQQRQHACTISAWSGIPALMQQRGRLAKLISTDRLMDCTGRQTTG